MTIDVDGVNAAIDADVKAAFATTSIHDLRMAYSVMAGRCMSLVEQLAATNETVTAVEQRFAEMAVEVAKRAVFEDRDRTAAELGKRGIIVEFAPWGEK